MPIISVRTAVRVNSFYYKLAYFNKMAASCSYGSTKQCSVLITIVKMPIHSLTVLCLWTLMVTRTLSYAILILHKLKQERKARLPVPVPLALGSVLILGQLCIASNSNLNGRKSFLGSLVRVILTGKDPPLRINLLCSHKFDICTFYL